MLRLAFDFIITWRETRTRPNAYTIGANAVVTKPIPDNAIVAGVPTKILRTKE